MAHANASAASPSSANETEDADANDVSEASDDASASVSDASVEISSKSATRASSSVGRLFALVSPLGTETFVSAPLGSVEVSLRVTSKRLCFFAFWRLSRRVEARSLSPSGPSPSSFFIGLGGSLPLVSAPSASAPGDDSTSPASLFESPTLWSLSVLGNVFENVSRRRLDEDRDGDDGPDADLLVRRSRRVRVGTVAESSSEEDAPFETRGGAVTTAIAVAVGVSGCASRWRARRSATSPLPPNRGVKGPQKREENSSVSPLARASSSSSSSLSEVSRRFPPSEGVAAPRARCQLGAIARLLCTTARIGGRSSARARRSAARRLNAPRKGGETTRAAIFQPGKKRTTERGRRDEKTGRPPRGEIWRHLRTSRGFLADEPEGRQPAPLPHGELVVVHRLRGVCVRGAGWLGGDSNRTRRFSFVSRQIRRVRHRALRVDARDARTTCALSASPASRVPLRREARSAWLFVATSARLLSSRLSSRSGARWYANSSANNEVERIFADSCHQAAGVWRSGCAVIRFRRKRSRTAFRFSSRNASIQTLAPLRAVVTPPLLRRRRTSGRIRRLRSGSPSAPGRHQARPRRGRRPRPRGRGR